MTPPLEAAPEKPLSIAILAMGGQGGGVLADWIVATAEREGWHAQSTSVPGVAQRTGATLYYIEMLPLKGDRTPVFALMPSPGDVDVVIAAELMEAGRSILRGLVTPDRTLLIASTQRSFAVAEKEKPGESIADPKLVDAAAGFAARRTIAFDMEQVAKQAGTIISAPLLGALAGAGVLPFPPAAFEAVIDAGGRGAAQSRAAFAEAFARAGTNALPDLTRDPPKHLPALPDHAGHPALDALLARIRELPRSLHPIVFAGVRRLVDYQDPAYAAAYLDRLGELLKADRDAGGEARGFGFTEAAAKHLANAMAYDDVIAVADAKTRARRFARIRSDVGAAVDQPLYLTEFMHPRAEELVGLLPAALGRSVSASPRLMRVIDLLFNHGRRIETATITGFLKLYMLSGMRRFRRRLLRHRGEMRHLEAWLSLALSHLDRNYGLATGIVNARRLVKGYSDTHARGLSKFDRVLSAVPHLAGREDAGDWMKRLVTAALKDEEGHALDGVLQTIATLDRP
jgi:indolepyruvate ferredoxin oxidoreductase beta subunit